MKKIRATVLDVANAAGVSVATVSRAFNKPEAVKEDVRNKVIEIARSLGYSPNPAAKALRLNKTNILAAVIPTLDYAIYAQMINSFQQVINDSGYTVLLLTVGFDNNNIYERVKSVVERGAEGVLIVGKIYDQKLRDFLKEKNIPVVCTYSYEEDPDFAFIGYDNYAITCNIVNYLSDLGHKRIAMVAGPSKGNDRQQARIRAYKETMESHGLADHLLIFESTGGFAVNFGAEVLHKVTSEYPETTALICNSDIFAFGVLSEAKNMGIPVPERLTVIGHDDMEIARLIQPPLTTVSMPVNEMGKQAAQSLLGALADGNPVFGLKLDSKLVVRESSGKPQ
ncbi:LacI family DNA-binding transcriptional regulator [Leeia sp. TBRC 13508]|uniref:LacI family DNA-binding transcriptional regulator n=1 Tax=Leeia speluncae TaxID=2884804 RepID=A0ABS8D8Y5_9NEIS|nr:LacI family DNA-binding transcriptional regulator [Leeia speluncae]MCB6184681.1 LacI family DNA-binding transcriptional regulator [Leeia speluncae]